MMSIGVPVVEEGAVVESLLVMVQRKEMEMEVLMVEMDPQPRVEMVEVEIKKHQMVEVLPLVVAAVVDLMERVVKLKQNLDQIIRIIHKLTDGDDGTSGTNGQGGNGGDGDAEGGNQKQGEGGQGGTNGYAILIDSGKTSTTPNLTNNGTIKGSHFVYGEVS